MKTVDSLWSDFLRLKDEQASSLSEKLNVNYPDIINSDALADELPILNAWMIKLTLEDQSGQRVTDVERGQLREAFQEIGIGNMESFDERFSEYEAQDNEVMTFSLAHESSFEKQAQVFLRHCVVPEATAQGNHSRSRFVQCVQIVASFIQYWVIAYISYGSHKASRFEDAS